jgi:hypothetical protein
MTRDPLKDYLHSPILTVDAQYEVLRLIFECSFNRGWQNGLPTVDAGKVPVHGKLFQGFLSCFEFPKLLGQKYQMIW